MKIFTFDHLTFEVNKMMEICQNVKHVNTLHIIKLQKMCINTTFLLYLALTLYVYLVY